MHLRELFEGVDKIQIPDEPKNEWLSVLSQLEKVVGTITTESKPTWMRYLSLVARAERNNITLYSSLSVDEPQIISNFNITIAEGGDKKSFSEIAEVLKAAGYKIPTNGILYLKNKTQTSFRKTVGYVQ